MENFWPGLVEEPSGNQPLDDFAVLIDNIPKIVYSTTLDEVSWKNSILVNSIDKKEVLKWKEEYQHDIFVGSPSLINAFTNLELIDEYQLCVHPVVLGRGLRLFRNLDEKLELDLLKTKSFECGAVVMYYSRKKAN
jgi:dihydrofolate reductase